MTNLRNTGIITKSEYVGKSLEEATEYATVGGFTTRVVEINGIAQMLDMSVKSTRLNFRVRNQMVIDVFGG